MTMHELAPILLLLIGAAMYIKFILVTIDSGNDFRLMKVITKTIVFQHINQTDYDTYDWTSIFKDNYGDIKDAEYADASQVVFRNVVSDFITHTNSPTYIGKYDEPRVQAVHPNVINEIMISELFHFKCIVDDDRKIACFVDGIAKHKYT